MTEYKRPINPLDKSFLAGALIGAAVGVVATMLLAPDSGERTRKKMKKKLQQVKKEMDSLQEKVAQEGVDVQEGIKKVASKVVGDIEEKAKKNINEAATQVAEKSQEIAEAMEDTKEKKETQSSGIRKPRRRRFFKGV